MKASRARRAQVCLQSLVASTRSSSELNTSLAPFWLAAKVSPVLRRTVEPAEDGPPETGIHRGDPPIEPLAVVSESGLPVLFGETRGGTPHGLVGCCFLQIQADAEKGRTMSKRLCRNQIQTLTERCPAGKLRRVEADCLLRDAPSAAHRSPPTGLAPSQGCVFELWRALFDYGLFLGSLA